MTKYKAKPCEWQGQKYDSQAEMRRHQELLRLEKARKITALERQVSFPLADGIKIDGEKRKRPAIRYVADFTYLDEGGWLAVEDVKGVSTPVYRLKKHLMATVHGIHVQEVKA